MVEDIFSNCKVVGFDLETTGISISKSKIIQFGIIGSNDKGEEIRINSLVNPQISIPEQSTNIHGITNSKVANSPKFKEKNDEIIKFLENSTLVGHNLINFDLKFLNHYLDRKLENNTIDTLDLSQSTLQEKVVNHKLNTLAEYFDVVLPTHNAKDDVMTTFEIYKKLLSIK